MRKILTNKETGATTYLEEKDVEGFFLAGARQTDYTVEDETGETAEPDVAVEVVDPLEAKLEELKAEVAELDEAIHHG